MEGEINRPGVYELKEDESLVDMINIAGGLKLLLILTVAKLIEFCRLIKEKKWAWIEFLLMLI